MAGKHDPLADVLVRLDVEAVDDRLAEPTFEHVAVSSLRNVPGTHGANRPAVDRESRGFTGSIFRGVETVEVDGSALACDIGGAGDRALAFVHGWCSKAEHWQAQAAHFELGYRVVRWDRRGMGRSRDAPAADSPQRHADDLAAILDRAEIAAAGVVGHAGGGPAALTFAAAYPDRVTHLVLVDTGLHEPPAVGEDPLAANIERSRARLLDGDDEFFAKLYRSFFGPRASTAVVDDAVANALATPRTVAASEMGHVCLDTVALAQRVTCPVLWVSAQPNDAKSVRSAFGDVAIGHVVGSGHFVQVEVPEQLDAMMDAFFDARGAA
jgi:pimeloyl-ACP methyl ester carboxylesterase